MKYNIEEMIKQIENMPNVSDGGSACFDFGEVATVVDVSTSYTIIDFKADGKGIAFGKASTEAGFDVEMATKFRQDVRSTKDVIAKLGETDQCSLVGVNERINKLLPHPYTLLQAKTATTTATTHTLLYSRKFTDYGLLTITIGTHQTDIRESMTVPMWLFYKPTPVNGVNTVNVFTLTCTASNGATNRVAVKYVSDTQVSIQLLTSGTDANIVNVYGVKTDDVAI